MTKLAAPHVRPVLVGPRVRLKPFEERDLTTRYLGWLNDPEVTRYLEVGKQPVTLEEATAYVRRFQQSATDLLFAIVERTHEQHIGNVSLNRVDSQEGTADTGLMIGEKAFWGKGYAAEAWSLLLADAFKRLGLRKVIAGAVAGHHASIRTLERLGFRLEDTVRRDAPGISWETYRFSLRPEDFQTTIGG